MTVRPLHPATPTGPTSDRESGPVSNRDRHLDGEVNCFARRRPHAPPILGGKPAKYLQPPGTPLRAYYPVASLPGLREPGTPVYLTEGEKKALAMAQLGLVAVGIGGVWCGCKKGGGEQHFQGDRFSL